jgi:beta-glucanase (GH16 family)
MPMPICKNITTAFGDKDKFVSVDDYLGDPDDADWVYSGYVEDYGDANILAMPANTSGTVLSSTRFVWYGKVGATLKTSRSAGVVTAFILFSNSQDEIDYEFVGYNLTQVETNFYYQAVLNYSNGLDVGSTDTFENYHDYEVDWTEEELKWYVDGDLVRTLKKADTWNETTEVYNYPQTPSRVQFSLWPAGDSNAVGTIEWAGGEVDWDAQDIQDYGYFFMTLQSAYIECYDPPSDTEINGNTSYIFNSEDSFDQENVEISNNGTVLGSMKASGLDPDEGSSSSLSSSSQTSSSTSSSNNSKTSAGDGTTTTEDGTTTSQETSGTTSAEVTGFNQFAQSESDTTTSASSNNAAVSTVGGLMTLILASLTFISLY